MRRNSDGSDVAELVPRAIRGHLGEQQLPERRNTGATCLVWRGEKLRCVRVVSYLFWKLPVIYAFRNIVLCGRFSRDHKELRGYTGFLFFFLHLPASVLDLNLRRWKYHCCWLWPSAAFHTFVSRLSSALSRTISPLTQCSCSCSPFGITKRR